MMADNTRGGRGAWWRLPLLFLLLALAACDDGAPAKTSRPGGPTRVNALALASAWGAVPIQQIPTLVDEQHRFIFGDAVTPDGAWLIGSVEPRMIFSATNEAPVVALLNVETHAIVRLHTMRTPRSQLLGATADGHWLVWSEAVDAMRKSDWILYACDLTTRQVTQLAEAVKVNGTAVGGAAPESGAAPLPTIDHGTVIWQQAMGVVHNATLDSMVVRTLTLPAGALPTGATPPASVTLATHAAEPQLAWPWALWRDVTPASGGLDVLNFHGQVWLKNLVTGKVIHFADSAAAYALAGQSVVASDAHALTLIADVSASRTAQDLLRVANPDHLQHISLSSRLVAWTQEGATQVWDRALRTFVRLPVAPGQASSWVGGHTLVWAAPASDEKQQEDIRNNLYPAPTLNVIDTSTLPATRATV